MLWALVTLAFVAIFLMAYAVAKVVAVCLILAILTTLAVWVANKLHQRRK